MSSGELTLSFFLEAHHAGIPCHRSDFMQFCLLLPLDIPLDIHSGNHTGSACIPGATRQAMREGTSRVTVLGSRSHELCVDGEHRFVIKRSEGDI